MYKISDNYYISANKVAKMNILTELNGKERYFITLIDGTRHEVLSREMFDEIASASGTVTYSEVVVTDKLTVGDIEDVEEELKDIRELIASDVKDMVGNYEELLEYDTSSLKVGDIIEVLQDENYSNANTMYRYTGAGTPPYEYIGKLGPYYTKDECEERFALKVNPDTPEPDPSEPSTNEDLLLTLTQMQGDPPVAVSVKLTLEELRQRFIASTDNDGMSLENAEIGAFIYEAIPESEIPATWINMNGRTAWEEQFANPDSTLNAYYTWSDDVNKPYKEDLWNIVENRAARLSDARKVDGEYVLNENGNYIYDNCIRCWLGAINAPGASYPWAVIELPIPFEGTISFQYKGEEPVYPWGEANRTFSRGFAIASIPDELGKPELKINAEGEAEVPLLDGDLVITLLPKLEEE